MKHMLWWYSPGTSGSLAPLAFFLAFSGYSIAQPLAHAPALHQPTPRERTVLAEAIPTNACGSGKSGSTCRTGTSPLVLARTASSNPRPWATSTGTRRRNQPSFGLLDPADYRMPFQDMLNDMEFTVVHELIHLELSPVPAPQRRQPPRRGARGQPDGRSAAQTRSQPVTISFGIGLSYWSGGAYAYSPTDSLAGGLLRTLGRGRALRQVLAVHFQCRTDPASRPDSSAVSNSGRSTLAAPWSRTWIATAEEQVAQELDCLPGRRTGRISASTASWWTAIRRPASSTMLTNSSRSDRHADPRLRAVPAIHPGLQYGQSAARCRLSRCGPEFTWRKCSPEQPHSARSILCAVDLGPQSPKALAGRPGSRRSSSARLTLCTLPSGPDVNDAGQLRSGPIREAPSERTAPAAARPLNARPTFWLKRRTGATHLHRGRGRVRPTSW